MADRPPVSGEPHPECIEAYHRELLLTGRTIMSVARVRADVAAAEQVRPPVSGEPEGEYVVVADTLEAAEAAIFGPPVSGEPPSIRCDCGHGLADHYGTSEGDRLPQPCATCDCDDFVESESDD